MVDFLFGVGNEGFEIFNFDDENFYLINDMMEVFIVCIGSDGEEYDKIIWIGEFGLKDVG